MASFKNLNRTYVGEAIELITLDLTLLGGNNETAIKYISNNQKTITFNGNAYTYLPCDLTGASSGPGDKTATLKISNITKEMTALANTFGCFAGGYVTRIRTFYEYTYLTNADYGAQYETESWKIMQMTSLRREEVVLLLGSEISESNSVVPIQIMTRSDYPGLIE